MNVTEIRDAQSQRPFKPFRLLLTTGREVPVNHQDMVLINQSATTLLALDGDDYYIVDLVHIVNMIFGGQPTADQLAS